jgi:hypothetical protein
MISAFIRRFLNLLFTVGIYKDHYKISYDGEIASFNQVYSGSHWGKRAAVKNSYSRIFSTLLLEAKVKPMTAISLIVFYNTKHDVDNLSYVMKMLVDTMKGTYIQNDGNKIYQSTHTIHDPSLPKGLVQFHIIGR